MVLSSSINRKHIFIATGVLIALWLFYPRSDRKIWNIYSGPNEPKLSDPKIDVFDFPALDSWEIRTVCETTKWNSSLVFTCDNNHGGVGHVRNGILNCVRYAIAAGASLVLPNIALREVEEEEMVGAHEHSVRKRHGPGRKGLEYMFDKEHFVHSLRHSCPELTLINDLEQTSGGRRRALLPEDLLAEHPTSGMEHPEEWPSLFETWVEARIPHEPQNERIVVDLEQSFLEYPTHSDGHAFTHQFGKILKFRSDVRRLATSTLRDLSYWYDLRLNLSEPVLKDSFLGAHIRTEDLMLGIGKRHGDVAFSHYEAQANAYLAHAVVRNLTIIYAASGSLSNIHKLAMEASQYGTRIDVTHKEDLLKGDDREELQRLTWDQRALVDYLVLLKAEGFVGVGHSSFSWNVALKRHENVVGKGRLSGEQPDGVWGDALSTLYGVRKGYVESSKCMWP